MLDATIKIRGRKGATFPSPNGKSQPMQTEDDFVKEAGLRFWTQKDVNL